MIVKEKKNEMNIIRFFIDNYAEETNNDKDCICIADIWKIFNKSHYKIKIQN